MILAIFGVIVGLALLTYASDQFVIGAARVATTLRVSPVVIGAVVIGFGTSAPELLVSTVAALGGSPELAIGNIVGSNVVNITLVLGVAAMITPVAVRTLTLKREGVIALIATLVFGVLVQGGLSAVDGIVLTLVLAVSLFFILRSARQDDPGLAAQTGEFLTTARPSIRRESVRVLLGLLAVLGAAQLLVVNATSIARELGVSEGFIGLTIVAIGTSLPELATAVQAARRRQTDLLIGNLLGSNLFNAAAVGAATAFAAAGQPIAADLTQISVIVMVGVSLLAALMMQGGRRVVRWQGAVLVLVYLGTLPLFAD